MRYYLQELQELFCPLLMLLSRGLSTGLQGVLQGMPCIPEELEPAGEPGKATHLLILS